VRVEAIFSVVGRSPCELREGPCRNAKSRMLSSGSWSFCLRPSMRAEAQDVRSAIRIVRAAQPGGVEERSNP
jgi:hypothetical protein